MLLICAAQAYFNDLALSGEKNPSSAWSKFSGNGIALSLSAVL